MAPGMFGVMGLMHRLHLTPEQHAQIRAIHEESRAKMWEIGRAEHETRMKLATTLPSDPAYARLIDSAKARAAERIQLQADIMSRVYTKVLTDAQRAEAQKLMAERQARWQAKKSESRAVRP
jgi:Spy/CpxP family protein refolding chaperone